MVQCGQRERDFSAEFIEMQERRKSMTEELRAQIMNVKLTKKEKLIAEFVLDHFAEACFITSTEIEKD